MSDQGGERGPQLSDVTMAVIDTGTARGCKHLNIVQSLTTHKERRFSPEYLKCSQTKF